MKTEIGKRLKAPTPKFWRKVRNTMIAVGTIGGTILALPAIPVALASIATYAVVIGTTGTVLAQLTKEDGKEPD